MAVVDGLPNSTVVDADIKDTGLSGDTGSADGAASSVWADASPAKVLVEVWVELLCCCDCFDQTERAEEEEQTPCDHGSPPKGDLELRWCVRTILAGCGW